MTPRDSEQQQNWKYNRQLAYLGSILHFMRSLYKGRLREEGFMVANEVKWQNTGKQRIRAIYNPDTTKTGSIPRDTLRYYRKILREPDYHTKTLYSYDSLVTINHDQSRSFSFIGDFIVIYSNADLGIPYTRSVLELLSPATTRRRQRIHPPSTNQLLNRSVHRSVVVGLFIPNPCPPFG